MTQRLRFLQIARVETLSEPTVNGREQFTRLLRLAQSHQRRTRLVASLLSMPRDGTLRARFPAPLGRSACSHICWSFFESGLF
jgi:hypothetical protein